jgi:signal transduction histidine kinase
VFPLQGRRVGVAIRDVTAVRRADLRVTESEMQLRTVVDGVSEGLLVAAEDGSIESANRAACTLFHLDAGPLPNLGDFLPFLLHEGAEPREVEARRTDGTRFPAEVMACSIAPDEKRRYVVVVRDLTSRREMDRVKKEFVSTVSHELRTPLTSIRGGLGLLEGGVLGKLEPRALEMVRIARSNAERLGVLLNDILDLEKIDAGKLEMHFDEHGADALVHGALDATRGMADAAGIELQAGALPPGALRCDEGRIVQVLSNLISNAIKFSTRGQSVRVDVDTNERRARFAIVDQGPGIPPDQLHKLFQRFQQLDGSDRRKVGGTGLGLAIVKAIVEQHGGIVGVESTPGHGSTFWFELPRSAPQATHAAPPP